MSQSAAIHAPLRIMGIQIQTELDQVHTALSDLWARWENEKASRLPSFTMTLYCVYQYDNDRPDRVTITLGRLVSQNLPLPPFAQETYLPAQNYQCYEVADMQAESLFQTWAKIEQDTHLVRTFTTDFETHAFDGTPKIYVGIA